MLRHDCLTPRVSLDFPRAINTVCSDQLLPVIVKPSICCCSEGCECESSPLTCVHKVFIFYKDWMFILSEVWACECWKKSQKTYCTAMRVYSCIRGVDCVIKTCAVNQWLSVQPRPVIGWNNTKGKKIYSTSIVVWDFMFWMLHVLLMVCQYILPTDYV